MSDDLIIDQRGNRRPLREALAGAEPLMTLDCIDEMIERLNTEREADDEDWLDHFLSPLTRDRVIGAMVLGPRANDSDAEDIVEEIMLKILDLIVEKTSVDPWPGLRRSDIKRMMGKRRGRGWDGEFLRRTANDVGELTLYEKFNCVRLRDWLEQAADQRPAS